jgi:hypothetical protein
VYRIRQSNPTHRNTPARLVEIGSCDLFFSYETLIGYAVPGIGRRRLPNLWGPTTGRHFKELGLAEAEVRDIDSSTFEREAQDAVARFLFDETHGELRPQ